MGDRRKYLNVDLRHGGDVEQTPELGGHVAGASHLPVQGKLVDDEPCRGRIVSAHDALLALYTAGQSCAYGLLGDMRLDGDQRTQLDDPAFLAERKRVREEMQELTERYRNLNEEF